MFTNFNIPSFFDFLPFLFNMFTAMMIVLVLVIIMKSLPFLHHHHLSPIMHILTRRQAIFKTIESSTIGGQYLIFQYHRRLRLRRRVCSYFQEVENDVNNNITYHLMVYRFLPHLIVWNVAVAVR